jgi:hypothetical protein
MSERFDTFSPPPRAWGEPDLTAAASVADEGGDLDPRDAAALLEQATRRAEQQFDLRPPFLMVAAAVTVLVAYGAVWLSVRHQHPYAGPSSTALGVLYGTLALWVLLVVTVLGRAVRGRSSPQRRAEAVVFAAVWICVYVFQGALHQAGADDGLVYGIWPAIAPLLVVGSATAGYEAARGKRASAAFAVAAVALAALGSFAGPRGVWAVMGIGLCSLLAAGTAAVAWQRRTTRHA